MRATVFRKSRFNAAHRLHNPAWNDEKNYDVFGKCSYENFHGHNYKVIVSLSGRVDEETGYVYDLKALSDLVKEKIEDRFDHKNLNLDTTEFAQLNPTVENIATVIHGILRGCIDADYQLKVKVYETENNFAEVGE